MQNILEDNIKFNQKENKIIIGCFAVITDNVSLDFINPKSLADDKKLLVLTLFQV